MAHPSSPINVNILSEPGGFWHHVRGFIVPTIIGGATFYAGWKAAEVTGIQSRAALHSQFVEFTTKAEDLYCPGVDGSQFELKGYIDRAAALEPNLQKDLVAIDYITLASIGNAFWTGERAREFGQRALELSTQSNDALNVYFSHMILGAVDFKKSKRLNDAKLSDQGRDHFIAAEQIVSGLQPPNNHVYLAQLREVWAWCESDVGEEKKAKELLATATTEQSKFASADVSTYRVNILTAAMKRGDAPRIPCPRTLALLAGDNQETPFPKTSAKQRDSDELKQLTTDQLELRNSISSFQGQMNGWNSATSERITALEKRIANRLEPQAIPPGSEATPPKSAAPMLPGPAADPTPEIKPPSEPGKSPNRLLTHKIRFLNMTNLEVHLALNRFVDSRYKVPPNGSNEFWVPATELSIARDSKLEVLFPSSIFFKLDGAPTQPQFIITDCCIKLDPGTFK